jgi:hypothetical protein
MESTLMKPFHLATAAAFTLAACAADPATVAPAYVSPVAYAGLDCRALAAEATRLNARIATVTGQQQDAAAADAANAFVAAFIFWPALFLIGNDDQSPELARLRGEAEALQAAATARGC